MFEGKVILVNRERFKQIRYLPIRALWRNPKDVIRELITILQCYAKEITPLQTTEQGHIFDKAKCQTYNGQVTLIYHDAPGKLKQRFC